MKYFFTGLMLLLNLTGISQKLQDGQHVNIDSSKSSLSDRMKLICPSYSSIPTELEIPMLLALIHFPEIKNSRIKFKLAKIKTTMNARPTMGSLIFRSKEKRTYIVRINDQKMDSVISIFEVPYNAQIGVFGHEFSHFVDYVGLSFWGVLKRGLSYGSPEKKSAYEKQTDILTIQHGLGEELLDWSDYVLNRSNATSAYKSFKRSTYLTPPEIKAEILRLSTQ
jgi:hypothetical protein